MTRQPVKNPHKIKAKATFADVLLARFSYFRYKVALQKRKERLQRESKERQQSTENAVVTEEVVEETSEESESPLSESENSLLFPIEVSDGEPESSPSPPSSPTSQSAFFFDVEGDQEQQIDVIEIEDDDEEEEFEEEMSIVEAPRPAPTRTYPPNLLPILDFLNYSSAPTSTFNFRMNDLSREMETDFQNFLELPKEKSLKAQVIKEVERVICETYKGARVIVHGSHLNGFGGRGCDVDFFVDIPGHREARKFFPPLKKALYKAGFTPNGPAIFRARVPLLPMRCPKRKVSFDLGFAASHGPAATNLFHAYSLVSPQLRKFGCLIKHWAKSRYVNDASKGTLSSFNWLMMAIYWAQRAKPQIAPCLHELGFTDFTTPIDVSAVPSLPSVTSSSGEITKDTLAQMFYSFVRFYQAFEGAIDIKTLSYMPHSNEPKTSGLLEINSPFEIRRSSAHLQPSGWRQIKDELKRAQRMIEQGKSWKEILGNMSPSHFEQTPSRGPNFFESPVRAPPFIEFRRHYPASGGTPSRQYQSPKNGYRSPKNQQFSPYPPRGDHDFDRRSRGTFSPHHRDDGDFRQQQQPRYSRGQPSPRTPRQRQSGTPRRQSYASGNDFW